MVGPLREGHLRVQGPERRREQRGRKGWRVSERRRGCYESVCDERICGCKMGEREGGDGERRRDEARGQQKRPERGNESRHRRTVSSQDTYSRWLTGQPRIEVSVEKRGVVCAVAARPRERVNRHERGGCCRSRKRAFNDESTEKEGREEGVTKTEFREGRDGSGLVFGLLGIAQRGVERLYTIGRTGPRPHGKVSRDWRRVEWRSGRTERRSD